MTSVVIISSPPQLANCLSTHWWKSVSFCGYGMISHSRGKGDLPAATRRNVVFSLCKCWTGSSYNTRINGRPHALSLQASNRALPMSTSFCNFIVCVKHLAPIQWQFDTALLESVYDRCYYYPYFLWSRSRGSQRVVLTGSGGGIPADGGGPGSDALGCPLTLWLWLGGFLHGSGGYHHLQKVQDEQRISQPTCWSEK